jgi:hypothetical protein
MRRLIPMTVMLWASLLTHPASAHFLFVRICPPAEGGRAAEVYFSELAAAGDPRYIDKVAGAVFWVQQKPGEFRPLPMNKLSDRLRAHVPVDGSLMVAGQLDYGVLNRPGQPPFLLRHYSKAVAGKPDEVNKLQARGTPLEVIATFEADRVVLTALLDGKPYPAAKFTTVDLDLSNEELKGDSQGQATFAPSAPSVYSVYIGHVRPDAGEHAGGSYKEVREFATLSFAWPLAPTGADPEAVKRFEDALSTRAVWNDFPGFTAKIAGTVEDRPFEGSVKVAPDGSVELKLDEDVLNTWVQEQLESITMHRAASQTPGADRPKPVLRFADNQVDHPLGRLLSFDGGQFASSYRVKDGQITSVNRLLDGKNMTITVLENQRNAEGKFLPRAYTVQYWDESTGQLDRTENVRDQWIRLDKWDLPTQRTTTTSSNGGFSVRGFTLSDHQLSAPKSAAAK